MPLLDISEILNDPDLSEPPGALQLIRSVETIDDNGRAQIARQTFQFGGNVQPAPGSTLIVMPDLSRASSVIEITTQARMLVQSVNNPADVVVWRCQQYRVRAIEDYTSYGSGFVTVTCELISLTSAHSS